MKKVRSKLHPTEIGAIKTFSLSPNDEIGEIAVECSGCTYYYNNLAELCEKWEDYEEPKPKKYWFIDNCGDIHETPYTGDDLDKNRKLIGNYFETKEEAELAVRKLKALERLEEKGFRFAYCEEVEGYDDMIRIMAYPGECDIDDVEELFGGEE